MFQSKQLLTVYVSENLHSVLGMFFLPLALEKYRILFPFSPGFSDEKGKQVNQCLRCTQFYFNKNESVSVVLKAITCITPPTVLCIHSVMTFATSLFIPALAID